MATTITYTLPGATLMSQLATATLDGLPNNDAQDNCVGESVAEGLHATTGRTYDGDEVKDAVYGAGYVGFESAASYIAYCAGQGVTLAPYDGATQQALIDEIHRQVLAGHPVIVTMPSQWGTAPADPRNPSGTTHCGVAVGVGPGMIRVMNPWGGFWQDQPDSWWAARLCYGQVWPMQLIGAARMIPTGWTDDGVNLTAPNNGVAISGDCRAYILSHAWAADDVPEGPEVSTAQVEFSDPAAGAGVVQYFRHSAIAVTPAAGAYALYVGSECHAARALLNTALAQVASLKAQLAAAQATPPAPPTAAPPTPQESAALAVIAALKTALAS